MRTKVLLGAAVLAAGLASSVAQVYSLNVVGYYNVTVPANNGYFMIANQLKAGTNTLQGLLPVVPAGCQFFKYSGGYAAATWDDLSGAWDTDFPIPVGEGGMFKNITASPLTLTFVGEVEQGSLTNTVPIGNSIRASMVPQEGKLLTDLGLAGEPNDQVYVYNGGYAASSWDDLSNDWDVPGGPTIKVGQGFFYKKAAGGTKTTWVRNFTVQ